MTAQLPRFILDLLSACPPAGAGVHSWLFRCARVLHHHYPDKGELAALLSSACSNCGRNIPEREIWQAVKNSEAHAWHPDNRGRYQHHTPAKAWPNVNATARDAAIKDGPALPDLWEMSPIRFEDEENHAEYIIDVLFPGDPPLCAGKDNSIFDTRPRRLWWGDLGDMQLIVPSPMSKLEGVTKEGKVSKHSLDNTGPRRFLVIEFDQGTFDEHAALLCHLGAMAPLCLAVHSGKKSLHGWFYCAGQPESKLLEFMRYAVTIGADPATWTRSQFVRMPEGTRDNGNRQTVFYFAPDLIKS